MLLHELVLFYKKYINLAYACIFIYLKWKEEKKIPYIMHTTPLKLQKIPYTYYLFKNV